MTAGVQILHLPLISCVTSASLLSEVSEVTQSCLTLCDPMDCSLPGSSVYGIFQASILEWVAISFSNARVKSESEDAQSYRTPSDPMDCSLPGSSVHGIFQASILEWVAIPFSRRPSRPRDPTPVSGAAGRFFTI